MKIVSKFQDYYDAGLAYGRDESIYFKRETKNGVELKIPKEAYNAFYGVNATNSNTRMGYLKSLRDKYVGRNLNTAFLSFCGTRYPFIHHRVESRSKTRNFQGLYETSVTHNYYWKMQDIPQKWRWSGSSWFRYKNQSEEEFWEPREDESANHFWNSPIVVEKFTGYRENGIEVIVNPCLKDIGFQTIVDPYTAFQEISMFLAGPLNGWEDPDLNPEPTEHQKLQTHGMDEYSFKARKSV